MSIISSMLRVGPGHGNRGVQNNNPRSIGSNFGWASGQSALERGLPLRAGGKQPPGDYASNKKQSEQLDLSGRRLKSLHLPNRVYLRNLGGCPRI